MLLWINGLILHVVDIYIVYVGRLEKNGEVLFNVDYIILDILGIDVVEITNATRVVKNIKKD